jgi:hypothetical protein
MTRKEFFNRLGIGVAVTIIAPKVIKVSSYESKYIAGADPYKTTGGIWPHLTEKARLAKYPLTPAESYRANEVIKIHKLHGITLNDIIQTPRDGQYVVMNADGEYFYAYKR